MTGNIDRVEVITSVQRRRRWSAEDARVNPRPDAAAVLRQLESWFEHCNTAHPRPGLICWHRRAQAAGILAGHGCDASERGSL